MVLSDVLLCEEIIIDGIEIKKIYCRFCYVYCVMEVDVKDGKLVVVCGD